MSEVEGLGVIAATESASGADDVPSTVSKSRRNNICVFRWHAIGQRWTIRNASIERC